MGKHATLNHDPNRSTSSRLSIVRVLDSSAPPTPPEPPPSPVPHHRRSLRRPSTSPASDHRLSFAFSSFLPPPTTPQAATPRPASSPSSPHLRPSSPSRRLSSSGSSAFSKPNLSPDQLLDLARQSTSPRFVQHSPGHPSASPIVSPTSPSAFGADPSPAIFTPLPPDVHLPFIDRPAEVTILLSTPPTTKLFSLLAQTFQRRSNGDEDGQVQFAADPSTWSFHTLRRWLTAVDRSMANDELWVRNARNCVLAHSELIWERLKGALGVPPELELENISSPLSIAETQEADKLDIVSPGFIDQEAAVDRIRALAAQTAAPTVTIEPIIATPSSNQSPLTAGTVNPPPLSLPSALIQTASISQTEQGLQDIVEGEEEEVSDSNANDVEDSRLQGEQSQIHGLCVSTSPVPSSPPISPHVCPYPLTPSVSSAQSETYFLSPAPRLSGRSSSGSLSSIGRPTSGSYTYRDAVRDPGSPSCGDSESDYAGSDVIGDRVPGNPLFPSNFARLTAGPTLRAKH